MQKIEAVSWNPLDWSWQVHFDSFYSYCSAAMVKISEMWKKVFFVIFFHVFIRNENKMRFFNNKVAELIKFL